MLHTAKEIVDTLRKAGHAAFVVGGAVRDMHLGREPSDFDVATSARADEVSRLFPDVSVVGKSYEITLVNGVEVAPFRVDVSTDGRQAEVEFVTDIHVDLARRDFTMNAMAMCPMTGEVLDPHSGKDDLASGVVRFVGDPMARLEEDFLRAVRAARFAADLGFAVDPAAADAVRAVADQVVANVAAERMLAELMKAKDFARMVELLFELGVGELMFPEVAVLAEVEQDPTHHPEGNAFVHTMMVLKNLSKDAPFRVKMAALFHDVGKSVTTVKDESGRVTSHDHQHFGALMAADAFRRLKLDNDTAFKAGVLVDRHMLPHFDVSKKTLRRFRNDFGLEMLNDLFTLARADAFGRRNLKTESLLQDLLSEEVAVTGKVELPLSGNDLMEMFGLKPGKEVGRLKGLLLDAALELDRPMTKDEAVELLNSLK